MDTTTRTETEIQRIDRHNGARAAAQGLLEAVSLMDSDAALSDAAPGLWRSCWELANHDVEAVRDVGQLMGLIAILRAPEVLTAALKRAARNLAEVADLPAGDLAADELAREQDMRPAA